MIEGDISRVSLPKSGLYLQQKATDFKIHCFFLFERKTFQKFWFGQNWWFWMDHIGYEHSDTDCLNVNIVVSLPFDKKEVKRWAYYWYLLSHKVLWMSCKKLPRISSYMTCWNEPSKLQIWGVTFCMVFWHLFLDAASSFSLASCRNSSLFTINIWL